MSERTASQKAYEKAKENGNLGGNRDYIKFKKQPERVLKFLDDEKFKGQNYRTKEDEWKFRYTFEIIEGKEGEEGKEVIYETAAKRRDPETNEKTEILANFPQQMAEFDYGDKIRVEYKPIEGTPRGYIDVNPAEDEDIPVVDEEEERVNPEDIPY